MSVNIGVTPKTVTILSGASLSDALDLLGLVPLGIQMGAAWTPAALTFQGSYDGVTYANVYDNTGTEVSVTVAASRYVTLPPTLLPGVRYIKVRSGTAGTPVAQAADRALRLMVRPLE